MQNSDSIPQTKHPGTCGTGFEAGAPFLGQQPIDLIFVSGIDGWLTWRNVCKEIDRYSTTPLAPTSLWAVKVWNWHSSAV
jgi:hypothetical protein